MTKPTMAEETRERYALKLAFATVGRFKECRTGDWDDLLSAALEGAAVALHRFDPTRGIKFSSYAIATIRQNVAKLRDLSPLWEMYQDGIDISSIQWTAH